MLLWVIVISIVIVAVLAMFGAASVRKRRLQKKVQFEVTNLGNLESRFQLLAEDPLGGLEFSFYYNGTRLPEIIKADQSGLLSQPQSSEQVMIPAPAPSKGQALQNAVSFGGALGSLLMSFGSLLPSSVGAPISRAGSQLYQGQVKASRVQQLSKDAARLGSSAAPAASNNPGQPVTAAMVSGVAWAETPAVRPGESMLLELLVKINQAGDPIMRAFTLKSKSAENEQAPLLADNGTIRIRGGFWSHRFYPQLLILSIAIALLIWVFWLSSIGVLY